MAQILNAVFHFNVSQVKVYFTLLEFIQRTKIKLLKMGKLGPKYSIYLSHIQVHSPLPVFKRNTNIQLPKMSRLSPNPEYIISLTCMSR